MDRLQVRVAEGTSVKARAAEDARQMQQSVNEAVKRAGTSPPKYVLIELIGKGSFGRVYRAKDMTNADVVAVKIIDIDASDIVNPRNADSYTEFLNEVNALKLLSKNKARNINHVIDALMVGKTVWMITEYCGGGSVATLMKPTPGGLQEKWIIPILREVAEALKWVHQAGIVHRDVKCANVLITEKGAVQLCDFGVAGIVETKLDKRSTFIGTPHWMAPELFGSTRSYGKEVDIWAFGSMVHEIATGLPPNVANGISHDNLGTHFKNHIPRLQGGNHSTELRSLVAYCLEEIPSSRPTIEQIQQHPYIHNTSIKYPTSTLSHLIRAFRLWEYHGGARKSLFMAGGAQAFPEIPSSQVDDEWKFSTTAAFDQEISRESTAQDVYEAYNTQVELDANFLQENPRLSPQQRSRRRPPPEVLAPLRGPLEKIFDSNTISTYEENSRNHYGLPVQQTTSDLPLRDNSAQISIKDTMIDLGSDHDSKNVPSNLETIEAGERILGDNGANNATSGLPDFRKPPLSDPIDTNNRRTQDWTFPSIAPPATAIPHHSSFSTHSGLSQLAMMPGHTDRPALVHFSTDPTGSELSDRLLLSQKSKDRLSAADSLIDLDMSLPNPIPELARPSTASSDLGSPGSDQQGSVNPFELEHHTSLFQPIPGSNNHAEAYSFSGSDSEGVTVYSSRNGVEGEQGSGVSDSGYASMPPSEGSSLGGSFDFSDQPYTMAHFPDMPTPPSLAAMTGTATDSEMATEMTRLLEGLMQNLGAFHDVYKSLP